LGPETTFVNVGAAGTSKGAAISWLIRHLNLTRDSVAVAGNGMNDLDAFDAVGPPPPYLARLGG
jgi:hydroxymethylpyrimidine pyrophosphatase-like HAD family hydrolase